MPTSKISWELFEGRLADHTDTNDDSSDDDSETPNHNIGGSGGSQTFRILTQDQRQAEKVRLYQAQRRGNWLTLKNQLPLMSTKSFDLDELGNIDWVRRADGVTVHLIRIDALNYQGNSRVWFILRDAYIEWFR